MIKDVAYVLHKKLYGRSNMLVTLISKDHGKISAFLNNATMNKEEKRQIESFKRYEIYFEAHHFSSNTIEINPHRKYEQVLIHQLELVDHYFLQNDCLWAGLYINELSYRLMPYQIKDYSLFEAYSGLLNLLRQSDDIAPEIELGLRIFEMCLLDFISILPDFTKEVTGHHLLEDDCCDEYYLSPELGIVADVNRLEQLPPEIKGHYLKLPKAFLFAMLDMNSLLNSENKEHLKRLKKVNTFLIHYALQGKPLNSVKMFKQIKQKPFN